jgi:HAE1 family hydrophobic/amphiphilic exporter-1
MTAATTTIGLLPLAIGGSGVGGAYYYPMARTIIGGLLSSTVLTLIILPYIDVGVEGVAGWLRRVWTSSRPRDRAEPSETTVPA